MRFTWSSNPADIGSSILGTLKLSGSTAGAVTTFVNAINLNGVDRTIQVDDNPNSTADYAVMSGDITGTGGIVKTGSGLLRLNGTNNYSGTTTIVGGVLQANIGAGIPSGSYILLNNGLLQFNSTTSFTYALGASGTNTFEWGTGGGGFSAGTSPLTVDVGNDGHTLVWGNNVGTQIVGPLILNSSAAANSLTFKNGIDLNGGARSLTVGANTVNLQGSISDSVGGGLLTKTGAGVLSLQAAGTFAGNMAVNGGTVVGAVAGAFGASNPSRTITVNAGTTLNFGASDMFGNFTTTNVPTIDIENGGTVKNSNNSHVAFNNIILRASTLDAAAHSGTPGSGGWGSFHLNGTVTCYDWSSISRSDGSAKITLQCGDVSNPNTTFDVESSVLWENVPLYDGIDGHTTGGSYLLHPTALTKTGAGQLILTVTNAYTGQTNVNVGTLQIRNSGALGSTAGKTVVANGAILQLGGGMSGTVYEPIDLNGSPDGSNGALQVIDPGTSVTVAGPIKLVTTSGIGGGAWPQDFSITGLISGNGGFMKYGPNRITLTNGNTFTGDTRLVDGTLAIYGLSLQNSTLNLAAADAGVLSFTGSFTLGGLSGSRNLDGGGYAITIGNNNQNTAYSGTLSNLTLNKIGNGTLTLSASNTFSGSVTITGGILSVSTLAANGSASNLGMGTSVAINGGTLKYTGGANTAFNRSITLGAGGGVIDQSGTSYLVSNGVISGSGALTKIGSSQLILRADNTFTGDTRVAIGSLQISGGALQNSTLDMVATDIGTLSVSASSTLGGLKGSRNVNGGGYTVSIGNNNQSTTYSGVLSSAAVTKIGTGVLTLTGGNSYTGLTTVAAGTLQLGLAARSSRAQSRRGRRAGRPTPVQLRRRRRSRGNYPGALGVQLPCRWRSVQFGPDIQFDGRRGRLGAWLDGRHVVADGDCQARDVWRRDARWRCELRRSGKSSDELQPVGNMVHGRLYLRWCGELR